MILARCLMLSVSAFLLFGCYHATIETGLTPSTEVIHETFASGWVYGLVPPKTIAAQAKCQHGVAKVETQLSFVNQLVSFLTLGIYTPMEIKVTCAADGSALLLPDQEADVTIASGSSEREVQEAFGRAAELAVKNGRPVFVSY